MPLVSVILPVYNCINFIKEAVTSILDQTFTDFELIIIDDCSTDGTSDILAGLNDSRVRVVHNTVNLKVVRSLNKGIELATGEYIARMDADDISHPERFERQVAFLKANPDIDICGTWVQTFGHESAVMRSATVHDHIKVRLFFINPIFHPSVMFRAGSFKAFGLKYDDYQNAEDYGLWVKAIDILKFAILPQVLLKYRIHHANVSVLKDANRAVLDQIHHNIYEHFLNKINVAYNENDLIRHRKLSMVQVGRLGLNQLAAYLQWIQKLTRANNAVNYFDRNYFKEVMLSYILYLVKQTSPFTQALKTAYQTLGDLYDLGDCTRFLFNRTKVKLHHIKTF